VNREKARALAALPAFLLPLLLICAVISRLDEKIELPGKFTLPAGTRILILGDSHAVCSLDPQRIGAAVNFASDGESYIHNFYKLKTALPAAPSLRTVILPVDLHSFSDFRSARVQVSPEWAQYLDYLEIGRIRNKRFYYLREWFQLRCLGFRGRYERIFTRWVLGRGTASVSGPDRGYLPKQGVFLKKNSRLRGRKRALRQLFAVDRFSPEMVLYFGKILELAGRHHLNVVLLRFPVTPEYLNTAEELMSIDRFYERIGAITRGYPRIHFLNRQRIFRRPPGFYFHDAQHLNGKGAEKFSDLIRRDLARLGMLDGG